MTDEAQEKRDQKFDMLGLDISHAIHEALRKGKEADRRHVGYRRTEKFTQSDVANDVLQRVSRSLRVAVKFSGDPENAAAMEMIANRLSPEKA